MGRIKGSKWKEKRRWVSKDGKSTMIFESELNKYLKDGWHIGHDSDTQKLQQKHWYTNGKDNIILSKGEPIPNGFKRGRISNIKFSDFKYRWYTNGVEQKRIKEGDKIPDGWYIGQSDRHKEKNRISQLKKGNYHLENKSYTDEYKTLYHDLDKLKEFVYNNNNLTLEQMSKRFNCPIGSIYALLNTHKLAQNFLWYHELSGISKIEKEIVDYIKNIYDGHIIENDRKIIYPQELDIYIPDKNLAIEFNGTYWHSNHMKSKNYHLEKSKLCEKLGIRLIHIFEWEWYNKQDICKSIISTAFNVYKQKIYARNCDVKEVDIKETKEFLNKNHIQGFIPSQYKLGLYYKNELVQLITIGKSRFKKDEYELLRMCTKLNTQVVGGFSKLMKHQPYKELISYVDRSKFTGNSYINSGWQFISYTSPGYFYVKGFKKINRMKAQKHKLKKLLGDNNFDANKTETQNMEDNNWFKIYDCGNQKLFWNKERKEEFSLRKWLDLNKEGIDAK